MPEHASMQKVAPPGKYHRNAITVRRLHDFVVAYGAAGLYDGLYSGSGQGLYAVGEGEEGVASGDGSTCPFSGFLHGYRRGVDPAHLACSYSDRGPVSGEDYGVALDHSGYAPGEDQVAHLLR